MFNSFFLAKIKVHGTSFDTEKVVMKVFTVGERINK